MEANLSILVTTKCTLHCQLCSSGVPYCKKPSHTTEERVFAEIDRAFQLYDTIAHADILGGEPLLHPDLPEIVTFLSQYRSHFPQMRILTNGTLVPEERLMRAVQSVMDSGLEFLFLLSDYGPLSVHMEECQRVLSMKNIPWRVDAYSGEAQRFGGWVDYGWNMEVAHPAEKVVQVYQECAFCRSGTCELYDGVLYPCVKLLSAGVTGRMKVAEEEQINLFNDGISLEEQRRQLNQFQTRNEPYTLCQWCAGLGSHAPRFPAAIQKEVDRVSL